MRRVTGGPNEGADPSTLVSAIAADRETLDVMEHLPRLQQVRGLSTSVYETLRRAIADGSLPPRLRLREIWLARHFGVSTTPVREALRRLEREGLVDISPNRGARVAAFDAASARNLYEVRELLEVTAIRKAVETRSADYTHVERLLVGMHAVIAKDDQAEFNRLDVEFHRALNDLGNNDILSDLAERVHRQIQSIRSHAAVYIAGRPSVSYGEHRAILDAVRRHDADEAERLLRDHLRQVRGEVLAVLGSQST